MWSHYDNMILIALWFKRQHANINSKIKANNKPCDQQLWAQEMHKLEILVSFEGKTHLHNKFIYGHTSIKTAYA